MPLQLPPIAPDTSSGATAQATYAGYINRAPPAVLTSLLGLLDVDVASRHASTVVFDDPTTAILPLNVMMVRVGVASNADFQTWNAGGGQFAAATNSILPHWLQIGVEWP